MNDNEVFDFNESVKHGLCPKHGKFPCSECGTTHYEGCECAFCTEVTRNQPTQLDRIERELTISRNENRMILDRLDKLLTPKKRKPRASKATAYPEDFKDVWKVYPQRAGSNPKGKAYAVYRKRIEEGDLWTDLYDGVERYARFCDATEITGGQFVMQAATFFGPDRHYENDWTIPKPPKDPAEINSPIHDAVDFEQLKAAEKRLDPVDPYADLKEQNDG